MTKRITLFLPILLSLLCVYGQKVKKIKEKKVSKVLQTLCSDDMEGRRVFTPGIDKAADFIAAEFKKAGLTPLDGETDYFQNFDLMEFSPKSVNVSINGQNMTEDNCLVLSGKSEVRLNKKEQADVILVKEGEKINNVLNKLLTEEAPNNQIILMHSSFGRMFGRLRQILSRFNTGLGEGGSYSKVFVLTDETEISNFDIDISMDVLKKPLKNVVGVIPGKRKDELVLYSGHYDHLGIGRAVEGDSLYNGANDDASGTTGVIALAHYFSKMPQPERTLVFVAFTAEEIGLYGSKYFSQKLDPEKVIAMCNMELIGVMGEAGPSKAFITGFGKSDFGALMQKAVENTKYTFTEDPYPNMNLFYRSDNATLARLGVPAHTFSSAPMNSPDSHYHKPSDDFETINMEHLTDLIKGIALGTHGIVNGTITPSRVDPTTVR